MAKRKATPPLTAAVLALAALFAACGNGGQPPPLEAASFAMDTVVEYKLYGEHAEQARQAIEEVLSGLEGRLSMYRDGSEISRLNRNAGGEFIPLSQDTWDLLSLCTDYGARSDGMFDVTVAPLTALWDVTAEQPRVPEAAEIGALRGLVDYRDIQLDSAGGSARLARKGQAVDVGGIAKGYACGPARQAALDCGITSGFISIGGNLMVIGAKPDGKPFQFGVRDPRGGPNDYLGIVSLPDSTMATSGDYERFFERDGVRYHHILDPATGYPAQSELMSVSVIAPDGAYADFMSTYLLIKGREFALQNLDSLDCGLIVVDKDRTVYVSESLAGRFTPSDKTGAYRFVTG